ncbi:LysR substrate-binding domain-containing protein [Cupriavidus basilensis]
MLHDDSTYTDVSNPDWSIVAQPRGRDDVDASRGPSFWPSHLVINAAISGLGVALVKKNWIEEDLRHGRLVRLFERIRLPVEFSYFVVFPEERLSGPRVTTFVNWLRAEGSRVAMIRHA